MTDEPFDYQSAIAEARRRFASGQPQALDGWAWPLLGTAGDVTSQCGEDGIIAALFALVGCKNRWCFEVGAHDGVYLSNTWALRQDGWDAVLIEAETYLYAKLAELCAPSKGATRAVHARVGPYGSLDRILSEVCAPRDLDLGVIDVDGPDAEVWRGTTLYRPRVMLVEFNPSGDGVQGGQPHWQAGLNTTSAVALAKGYRPVLRTSHNAFFVDESVIKEST